MNQAEDRDTIVFCSNIRKGIGFWSKIIETVTKKQDAGNCMDISQCPSCVVYGWMYTVDLIIRYAVWCLSNTIVHGHECMMYSD